MSLRCRHPKSFDWISQSSSNEKLTVLISWKRSGVDFIAFFNICDGSYILKCIFPYTLSMFFVIKIHNFHFMCLNVTYAFSKWTRNSKVIVNLFILTAYTIFPWFVNYVDLIYKFHSTRNQMWFSLTNLLASF